MIDNKLNILLPQTIGLIFLLNETIIAHAINKNSSDNWVIIHQSNQYLGMVYIHMIIQTATPIALIHNNRFCLSVATNK
jgi:hypothetical protein